MAGEIKTFQQFAKDTYDNLQSNWGLAYSRNMKYVGEYFQEVGRQFQEWVYVDRSVVELGKKIEQLAKGFVLLADEELVSSNDKEGFKRERYQEALKNVLELRDLLFVRDEKGRTISELIEEKFAEKIQEFTGKDDKGNSVQGIKTEKIKDKISYKEIKTDSESLVEFDDIMQKMEKIEKDVKVSFGFKGIAQRVDNDQIEYEKNQEETKIQLGRFKQDFPALLMAGICSEKSRVDHAGHLKEYREKVEEFIRDDANDKTKKSAEQLLKHLKDLEQIHRDYQATNKDNRDKEEQERLKNSLFYQGTLKIKEIRALTKTLEEQTEAGSIFHASETAEVFASASYYDFYFKNENWYYLEERYKDLDIFNEEKPGVVADFGRKISNGGLVFPDYANESMAAAGLTYALKHEEKIWKNLETMLENLKAQEGKSGLTEVKNKTEKLIQACEDVEKQMENPEKCADALEDASGAFTELQEVMNDFLDKNRESQEHMLAFEKCCGPFLAAWGEFDFIGKTRQFEQDVPRGTDPYFILRDRSEQKQGKVAENQQNLEENVAYHKMEIKRQRINVLSDIGESLSDAGMHPKTGFFGKMDTFYDVILTISSNLGPSLEDLKVESDKCIWGKLNNQHTGLKLYLKKLSGTQEKWEGITMPDIEKRQFAQDMIVFRNELMNIVTGEKMDDKLKKETKPFRKLVRNFMKEIDAVIHEQVLKGDDWEVSVQKYIALNSGSQTNQEYNISYDKGSKRLLANAVGAYLWRAEVLKQQKDGKIKPGDIKLDINKIEKYANDLPDNPVFKKIVADNDAKAKKNIKNGLDFSDPKNIVMLYEAVSKPFKYHMNVKSCREALRELAELGRIVTTDRWAGKDYKKMVGTLEELGKKDPDTMTEDEIDQTLQDIFEKTKTYMKGRKSVRWGKERRERFEQALDILAIIGKTGEYGKDIIEPLKKRTNEVRKKYDQAEVFFEGRSNEQTKLRLQNLRKRLKTEDTDRFVQAREDEFKADTKLVKASKDLTKETLVNAPKETKALLDVDQIKAEINETWKSETAGQEKMHETLSKMLALTVTSAYKDTEQHNVVDAKQFHDAVKKMEQHEATTQLSFEFENVESRNRMKSKDNPEQLYKDIRTQFDVIALMIKAEDAKKEADLLALASKLDKKEYAKQSKEYEKQLAKKERAEKFEDWKTTDEEKKLEEFLKKNVTNLTEEQRETLIFKYYTNRKITAEDLQLQDAAEKNKEEVGKVKDKKESAQKKEPNRTSVLNK